MAEDQIVSVVSDLLRDGLWLSWPAYVLVFTFAVIGCYFGAYLRAKGENLATKEDIRGITRDVEGIKTSLALWQEEVTGVRQRGREAAIGFFDACTSLLHESLELPIGDASYHTGLAFADHRRTMMRHFNAVTLTHARLLAYFHEDDQLLRLADAARVSANKLKQTILREIDAVGLAEWEVSRLDPGAMAKSVVVAALKKQSAAISTYELAIREPLTAFKSDEARFAGHLATFFKRRFESGQGVSDVGVSDAVRESTPS